MVASLSSMIRGLKNKVYPCELLARKLFIIFTGGKMKFWRKVLICNNNAYMHCPIGKLWPNNIGATEM